MEDNIDLKNIWHQQRFDHPDLETTIQEIKQYKRKGMKKTIFINLSLIATVVLVGFFWYYFQPQFMTTKIGTLLIILAIVIFIYYFNKLSKVIQQLDTSQSNSEYLKNLNDILNRQKFIQTKVMSLYFILLSAGVCLYLYEYVLLMPPLMRIIAYLITLVWIGVNWFYFRPKMIKKQEAKINGLIKKFEDISRQINE